MRLRKIIKEITYSIKYYRVFYTIYFNYRYLPFKQFKKLPIRFYKNSYATISAGGRLILSDEMVQKGAKVKIGFPAFDFEYQCEKTYLNIYYGFLKLNGNLEIRRGGLVDIRGEVECDANVLFGARSRVRIHNKATFGKWARISHETQVFDTNFHPMEKVDSPGFYPMSKPIHIGSHCWIANRCTIGPGANLPDNTTVASNSLVNKDYSSLKANSVIGGIPAKLIKEGYSRVWDTKRELEYHKKEFPWYPKGHSSKT